MLGSVLPFRVKNQFVTIDLFARCFAYDDDDDGHDDETLPEKRAALRRRVGPKWELHSVGPLTHLFHSKSTKTPLTRACH